MVVAWRRLCDSVEGKVVGDIVEYRPAIPWFFCGECGGVM